MARGLSNTQKTILKVIRDLPEGSELNNIVYPMVKAKLYPELYGIWDPHLFDVENRCIGFAKFPGWNIKKKNNARVVISKSTSRLVKRKYLLIITESLQKFIPSRRFKGETIPWKSIVVNRICIYLTHAGRRIVNG